MDYSLLLTVEYINPEKGLNESDHSSLVESIDSF